MGTIAWLLSENVKKKAEHNDSLIQFNQLKFCTSTLNAEFDAVFLSTINILISS